MADAPHERGGRPDDVPRDVDTARRLVPCARLGRGPGATATVTTLPAAPFSQRVTVSISTPSSRLPWTAVMVSPGTMPARAAGPSGQTPTMCKPSGTASILMPSPA
ncbi:MAG: hypothetical protein R3F05_11695 [Planctomycetota bacterium]